MATITLTPILHQSIEQIKIEFDHDVAVENYVKKFRGVKWSRTHEVFCLPFTKKNTNDLYIYLRKQGHFVNYSALKAVAPFDTKKNHQENKIALTTENKKRLLAYQNYLRGLRLSPNTIATYTTFICYFLGDLKDQSLDVIDNTHIRLFIERLQAKKNFSISSHRQLIGAIKHFAQLFGTTAVVTTDLRMPRKDKKLPVVLSQYEIINLLRYTTNIKHKATLALLYSAGLRISEIISLRLADIDINRRQLHIKNAKGRKDRYVVIAESTIALLHNYVAAFKPKYLFIEGQNGKPYSATSIRKFLKKYCKAAGIHKNVTPHSLRHSYATHLIENGVGLRHVQELLGHSKPETTMIYTHIAKKDLLSVTSPLDEAVRQFQNSAKVPSKVSLSGSINP